MKNINSPLFSIVIPTLNEEKFLPNLLEDLSSQTLRNFEVIISDGQSSDNTVKVVKKFKKIIDIKIIDSEKRNVSYQRNIGAKLAIADWIIFMDADNRLSSFFLQGIRYQLDKNPDIDVFTCWIARNNDESKQEEAIENLINISVELYNIIGKPLALGALIGCRRELALQLPFDETQKVFEDGLFIRNLVNNGANFEIFKDPRFFYSLRRYYRENKISLIKTIAKLQIMQLQNKNYDHFNDYKMLGGSYYIDNKTPLFKNVEEEIKKLSKIQLQRLKKIMSIVYE